MQEYGLSVTLIFPCKTESAILPLYWKIRAAKNPYYGIFYAMPMIKSTIFKLVEASVE